MATTPAYGAANRLAADGTWVAPVNEALPRIANLPEAIHRAEHVHEQTMLASRVVTAAAFFFTAIFAVGNRADLETPMLGFLAVALLSAASSGPLARYRFRSEINAAARAANLSARDARRLAKEVFAEWAASPKRTSFVGSAAKR